MKAKWYQAIKEGAKLCELRAASSHWLTRIEGASHCSFTLGFLTADLLKCLFVFSINQGLGLKGYDQKTKIMKRILRTETIPAASAADYGVSPEEMEGLFQRHTELVAVHFK